MQYCQIQYESKVKDTMLTIRRKSLYAPTVNNYNRIDVIHPNTDLISKTFISNNLGDKVLGIGGILYNLCIGKPKACYRESKHGAWTSPTCARDSHDKGNLT